METTDKKTDQQDTKQLLVFELADEEYGVDLTDLKEIIEIPDITPIPNSPEFIDGIIDLRGEIVVVLDLKIKFDLHSEKKHSDNKKIIVTNVNNNAFGLLVDNVVEILKVPENSIKATPELVTKKIHADYLKGVSTLDERLILLLDLANVLKDENFDELTQGVEPVKTEEAEVNNDKSFNKN